MHTDSTAHLPKLLDTESGFAPKAPTSVEQSGIERNDILNLILKAANGVPQFTAEWLSSKLLLPQIVLVGLLEELRHDALLEARGQDSDGQYKYAISERGRAQAAQAFSVSGYVGPAPVSLESYLAVLEHQVKQYPQVTIDDVQEALSALELAEESVDVAGMAISSGKSLFVSGPPGNGKTTLARALHNALPGDLWIPHAIAVDNTVISLYDPHCHHQVDKEVDSNARFDQRWIRIHRPLLVVGGEMTLDSMDLAYREGLRYYEAPLHMKANGGTFLIDDFGRQHVAPAELLNRWIVPLEHQFDFLTLHSGQKIEVPFILMLIFATNLDPEDVTDPAFLRRIGYRMKLDQPSEALYEQIFRGYAEKYEFAVSDELAAEVLERYRSSGRELRACEPRDLIERIRDICRYQGMDAHLDSELFDTAWRAYFGEKDQPDSDVA